MTRHCCCVGIAAVAFLIASPLPAATVALDLASFGIAPGYYLESFDGLTAGSLSSPQAFSNGVFSFQASAPSGLFAGSGYLSTNLSTELLTFTFLGGNVTAVGGHFLGTDADFNPVDSTTTLVLSDGTNVVLTYPDTFRGFTTAGGVFITSLTVSTTGAETVAFPTVDDLYVGQAQTAQIPEPASVLLVAGGLLAAAARLRRRRMRPF